MAIPDDLMENPATQAGASAAGAARPEARKTPATDPFLRAENEDDDGYNGGGYGAYARRTTPVTSYAAPAGKKPETLRTASAKAAPRPAAPRMELQPGEMVEHDAFGRGMVLSVHPVGGDAMVEVAFDKVGTKRLMLKMAAQHLQKCK